MTKYIDSVRAALEEMAQIEEKKKMKKIPENDYENDDDDDDDDEEENGKKKKNGKKDDMDEAMDPVNPKAVKKDFKDRKDKDIDNDGDVDDSDEYLHKKRKAISKSKGKNEDEPEGEKGETAVMNPKKEQKATKESTIRDRLMSIWEDAAGAKRMKDQNREPMTKDDERSAKKMKDGHGAPNRAGEIGKEADDTDKAERSGPSKKARPNDNMQGDRNVINKIANAYKKLGSGKDM